MKRKGVFILLIIVSVTYVSNGAEIIYVDVNGPADFDNIQAAIDDANDGDIVIVAEGIYTGAGNYNIDAKGKTITVRSTDPNDPNVVDNTIIDPEGTGRGFYFHTGEDINCEVSGFAIQNASNGVGGAIMCDGSSPIISNCIIRNNSAVFYGGGVFCLDSDLQMIGCTIIGNSADRGGGIDCWSGAPKLINCIIVDNEALDSGWGGGGVDCYGPDNNPCKATLQNCTVAGNSASSGTGGGVLCVSSDIEIKNSIMWGNQAQQGSQIAVPSWFGIPGSSVTVKHTDVQGGSTAVYVDPNSTLNWGSGNIDSEPSFVHFDPNSDPNIWDFHLQSAYGRWDPNSEIWVTDSNTSLCIDAGDPNSDWSAESWPNGKRVNMGVYGGTRQASMNGNASDFDVDGEVNFKDFCELAGKWLRQGNFVEDLFNDGTVNIADLHIFVEDWLWCQE